MSVVEKLRLLEIWATRKGLWIYIKMTMGCLGEGLKDPKKRGMGNGASNWRDPPAKEICVPMTRGDHMSSGSWI